MSYRLATVVLLALFLSGGSSSDAEPDQPAGDERRPLDSSLVERTERRLIQLDISLFPKKKRADVEMPELSPDDLELLVGHQEIELRFVDRGCRLTEPTGSGAATDSIATESRGRTSEEAPSGRGTYLFYFEHSHLTMPGQQNALVMAEEMIPRLVGRGARGMVVSSGDKVLQSDLTDDPEELLAFIDSIRGDFRQWGEVAYAEGETSRYADVLDHQIFQNAKLQALRYAREERIRTSRQLRRFAAVLGSFVDLDPPKAVVYFADIIRKNPGQHYEAVFSNVERNRDFQPRGDPLQVILHDAYYGGLSFDRVTEQAAAHGTRVYTIRARGLEIGYTTLGRSTQQRVNQMPEPYVGIRDAEDAMIGLAQETGGASFRGGAESSTIDRVLDRIQSDLSCVYVLSFEPEGILRDSLLSVFVRFDEASPRFAELDRVWDVRNRGQLLVQSETRRKEAILLAAHTTPGGVESETGRSRLIPLGFVGGEYHALVQFAVESPKLPSGLSESTTWDLGMSFVAGDRVLQSAARRLEVGPTGVPIVLEAVWRFSPGHAEVVSVGYEHRFGQLAAIDVDSDWPDPDGPVASITPIVVVQPADGLFLRVDASSEDERRNQGTLAIGDSPAHLDRPVYFVGLVCRNKRGRDLWIDRKLVGNTSVDFELQSWSGAEEERCVQIRDLIRPGQAGWGDFRYEVRVYDDETLEGVPLAEQVRVFTGLEGGSG